MRAMLNGHVVAQSVDVAECEGYRYFKRVDVRMEWLEPAARTASDHACPHGVHFYDVVIDGVRYPRVAWSYEAPLAPLQHVTQRMGFWKDVETR